MLSIQNDASKLVYQSAAAAVAFSNNLNAAFQVQENLGASPFEVNFEDYSTCNGFNNNYKLGLGF
ncbi:MAG: hypothetical protein MZV64_55345 [Ignavibacteriales bacterium]|nr:hypothetical protein [Ignavibacteriales bacterium]